MFIRREKHITLFSPTEFEGRVGRLVQPRPEQWLSGALLLLLPDRARFQNRNRRQQGRSGDQKADRCSPRRIRPWADQKSEARVRKGTLSFQQVPVWLAPTLNLLKAAPRL